MRMGRPRGWGSFRLGGEPRPSGAARPIRSRLGNTRRWPGKAVWHRAASRLRCDSRHAAWPPAGGAVLSPPPQSPRRLRRCHALPHRPCSEPDVVASGRCDALSFGGAANRNALLLAQAARHAPVIVPASPVPSARSSGRQERKRRDPRLGYPSDRSALGPRLPAQGHGRWRRPCRCRRWRTARPHRCASAHEAAGVRAIGAAGRSAWPISRWLCVAGSTAEASAASDATESFH